MAETDPYVYPGTDVLRNRFGIRDAEELGERERQTTALAMARVTVAPLAGNYDLAHLQKFHREVFRGLYDWAGEIRTVAIAKSQLFCLPQHIDGYAEDVFNGLKRNDYLRGRSRAEFLDGAAELWADVNALHPFREGNGRSTRAFLGQLSTDAGWPVTWKYLDADTNIAAAIASMNGDNTGLRRILEERTPILKAGGQTTAAQEKSLGAERAAKRTARETNDPRVRRPELQRGMRTASPAQGSPSTGTGQTRFPTRTAPPAERTRALLAAWCSASTFAATERPELWMRAYSTVGTAVR